jgi:hypothetical protein
MDFSSVVVQEEAPEVDGELATLISSVDGSSPKAIPAIWSEVSDTLVFSLFHTIMDIAIVASWLTSFGRSCGSLQTPISR